jgi:dTDP-4-amino-4,6-dideoxygalactose transaminase
MSPIPVMRPKLPSRERLAPYLDRIDRSRIYSNYGPIVCSLQERLAAHYGVGAENVTTVTNATLGLTLALQAQNARPGLLCLLPAWTFVASVHAVMTAGLVPHFVHVSPETWAMDAAAISDEIARAPSGVGAVMPVAPFGRPIDVAPWDEFAAQTGMPVVIDAAAGFDAMRPGRTPAVVSLHATKVIGTGEGGFVMSTDAALVRAVQVRANFGFEAGRQASVPSANGKMSEFHAAVGLAAFDEWEIARSEWMAVARAYRDGLAETNRIRFQDGFGETWISSTCILHLADTGTERIESELAASGIDTRRWWGRGAHTHPATRALSRSGLRHTETLAQSTIGVPMYRDLCRADVARVAERIRAAL